MGLAVAVGAAGVFCFAAFRHTSVRRSRLPDATYAQARDIVDRRCVECHSARPINRAFPFAPKGVVLDTGEQMKVYAQRIKLRVVIERTMPLANMTGMSDRERDLLGGWIDAGAQLP